MHGTTSFQVYNAYAGSGKTFTLVKEYLKILLISDNPYKFQQILAVTFTNKAAGEMRERIIRMLGKERSHINMGPFHSICARILRREALYIGYEQSFSIYDDDPNYYRHLY